MPRALVALVTCLALASAETAPDPQSVRAGIDRLLAAQRAAHRPLTLGVLRAGVDAAISFGAPTYNAGDRAGCADFYAATARALVAAAAAGEPPAAGAAQGVADLRSAAERAIALRADDDHRAWTLRLAFDQVALGWELEAERGRRLARIGLEYLQRGMPAEAEAALLQADEARREILGGDPLKIPIDVRAVVLFASQAQLLQGRIEDAAATLAGGLSNLGELATANTFDLRTLQPPASRYPEAVGSLDAHVAAHPADHDARALLVVAYRFSDRRAQSDDQLAMLAAASADHPAVRLFGAGKPLAPPTVRSAGEPVVP